jgi:hypothetical protein
MVSVFRLGVTDQSEPAGRGIGRIGNLSNAALTSSSVSNR